MKSDEHTSTKQEILQLLLKEGRATAQDLSDRLQISPQAIRRHLRDLEEEELILHQTGHEIGQPAMGRPQHFYQLSRAGRDRFPDDYDRFALDLLMTLTDKLGSDRVSEILHEQWVRKAVAYRDRIGNRPLQEKVEHLAEIRRSEGFVAEWYHVEGEEAYVFTEYNCAISQIAETFPSVCGHELEMFAIALQDCRVERTHWMVDGEHRCGYLIRQAG